MFVTDDLSDWVNPLGYEQAVTPNLDRLAEMGVDAHAPGVFCAPSRTAIWTGLRLLPIRGLPVRENHLINNTRKAG